MNGVFETQTFVHIVDNTSQKWRICLYQQQILAVIPYFYLMQHLVLLSQKQIRCLFYNYALNNAFFGNI